MGVGFVSKYSAAIVLVPIFIAHFLSRNFQYGRLHRLGFRQLAIGLGTAVISAIIVSPHFIITSGKVLREAYDALYLEGKYGFDGWQFDPSGGYIFYLKTLIWGLSWIFLALSLLGVVTAIWRHSSEDLILLSLPITLYLVFGRQQMYFARFILPALPAFLVIGAALLDRLAIKLTTITGKETAKAFYSYCYSFIDCTTNWKFIAPRLFINPTGYTYNRKTMDRNEHSRRSKNRLGLVSIFPSIIHIGKSSDIILSHLHYYGGRLSWTLRAEYSMVQR